MFSFSTRRKVEFADTDMGGIVHFSRYFVFMETAEHQFLESLGTSVDLEVDGRHIGWPRVSATCDYRSPARFGDQLEISVQVKRKGTKSITYEFSFAKDGEVTATGMMTSVCCELGREGVRPIPIPEFIASKLSEEG